MSLTTMPSLHLARVLARRRAALGRSLRLTPCQRLVGGDLALAQHGEHPRDVAADLAQPRRAVELAGRELEAQVEQLLARVREAVEELLVPEARRTLRPSSSDRHLRRAVGPGSHDELRLHRQLLDRALHGGARERLVDAAELEEHPAGLDDGDPVLGVALARAHAGLGGLLGDGLVGEHADPDLPAASDVAGHRDSGRLDLARGQPRGLERLDAEVAEVERRPALRLAAKAAALLLAVPRLAGHQHLVHLLAEVGGLVVVVRGAALDLLLGAQARLELVGLARRRDQVRRRGVDALGVLGRRALRLGASAASASVAGDARRPRPRRRRASPPSSSASRWAAAAAAPTRRRPPPAVTSRGDALAADVPAAPAASPTAIAASREIFSSTETL